MIKRERKADGGRERGRGREDTGVDTRLIKPGMLIALALGESFHPPSVANDRAFPLVSHARARVCVSHSHEGASWCYPLARAKNLG